MMPFLPAIKSRDATQCIAENWWAYLYQELHDAMSCWTVEILR